MHKIYLFFYFLFFVKLSYSRLLYMSTDFMAWKVAEIFARKLKYVFAVIVFLVDALQLNNICNPLRFIVLFYFNLT